MIKENISFEQLMVLAFLKFTKIDSMDITLLINEMKDIADVSMNDDSDDYSILADGTVLLEKKYINEFYKNVDMELLQDLEGNKIYQYIMNIDMLEFVLKKIKMMGEGCVVQSELDEYFSPIQRRFINLAYQKKYIMDYTQKDKEYEDYCAVKLTKIGEVFLFLRDNHKKVEEFYNLLQNKDYNVLLFDAFLIVQDLSMDVNEILTEDNFISFCNEYDKDIYKVSENTNLKRVRAI